jgi:hypothetical protein
VIKFFLSIATTSLFQNAIVPFASSCGCANRTSYTCGSSEKGAVFAQVAALLQKHLSTALHLGDGQIGGYQYASTPLWLALQTTQVLF